MKYFNEIGGYCQMMQMHKGQVINITCTCMKSTMEISRHKNWIYRDLCKHLKKFIKHTEDTNMADGKAGLKVT